MAPDAVLYRQGDAADSLYYLDSGAVMIGARGVGGSETLVALLGHGTFFGARSLGEEAHNSTATALLPSTLVRMSKADVRDLLLTDPLFAQHFALHMMRRASALEEEQIDRAVNPVEKRLARLLLILASLDAEGDGTPMLGRFTDAMLASMLATAPSCIARLLHEFRTAGHLGRGETLTVHSSLVRVLLPPHLATMPSPLDEFARPN